MPNFDRYSEDRTKKWCKACGFTLPVDQFRMRTKRRNGKLERYLTSECKRCEGGNVFRYRATTEEGVAAEIHRRLKHRAFRYGLPFDLTKRWIQDTLRGQHYRCALTGIEMACQFTAAGRATVGFAWNSISADRIRQAGGYTRQNVRFVLNIVNLFRNDGDDSRMYRVAEALLARRCK